MSMFNTEQLATDSSETALLKTQMAAMTELSHESRAGGSRILGSTTNPYDNIPGKVLQVPQDGAHGPALPEEGTRRKPHSEHRFPAPSSKLCQI